MPLFRIVAALLIFAVAVCVSAYLLTGQRRYLRWAGLIVRVLVGLGIAFFGVLILERVV